MRFTDAERQKLARLGKKLGRKALAEVAGRKNPGRSSPSALLTQNGGRYGAARRAQATVPDPDLWPAADFALLVDAFRVTGFRPANSWYLNDPANIAYAAQAPDAGRLHQPVLFVNGTRDALCDIGRSGLGEPMRASCNDLTATNVQAGHWVPLEAKSNLQQDHARLSVFAPSAPSCAGNRSNDLAGKSRC